MLAQRRTPDEGGEAAILPDLLAGLDLRGALASLDAASCHPTTAAAITERGGDCLIALKGSRRALHAPRIGAVRGWFEARAFTVGGGLRPCSDGWDDEHGRLVRRRVLVADVAERAGAEEFVAAWPGPRRIVAVEAIRSVANPAPNAPQGVRCQSRHCLDELRCPRGAPEERIAAAVRAHRAIEDRLRLRCSTPAQAEDLSRVRDRTAAANLAVLRRIARNLVRADTSRAGSPNGRRKMAGWDDASVHRPLAA